MLDFFNRLRQFNPRVNNAVAMLEKRREIAKADVTIFINGGANYGAAMPPIPYGIVGSPAEKRDAERRSAHDHRTGSGCRQSGVLSLWNNAGHRTAPA